MEDGNQTLDRMREREQKGGNLIQECRKKCIIEMR